MVDSDPLIFTIVLLSSCLGLLCIPMIRYVVRQENRSLVYLFGVLLLQYTVSTF